jgi:hypothetical protein
MQTGPENLTGVWQGLYTYPAGASVSFVATLIESGQTLSGAIHEPRTHGAGRGETIYATLLGSRSGSGSAISFVKTYDRAAGPGYGRVDYEGTLNGDRTEIEGRWKAPGAGSGKFLMIRSAGKAATSKQKKSVRV